MVKQHGNDGDRPQAVDVGAVPGHVGSTCRARTRRSKPSQWAGVVAKGYRPDSATVSKRTGGLRRASCEKGFRRKYNIVNPLVDAVDGSNQTLCNIESSTRPDSNRAVAMVTVTQDRYPRIANADNETTEAPAINHAGALRGAVRRFGTDLAQ
jgi:hypothetical protein